MGYVDVLVELVLTHIARTRTSFQPSFAIMGYLPDSCHHVRLLFSCKLTGFTTPSRSFPWFSRHTSTPPWKLVHAALRHWAWYFSLSCELPSPAPSQPCSPLVCCVCAHHCFSELCIRLCSTFESLSPLVGVATMGLEAIAGR